MKDVNELEACSGLGRIMCLTTHNSLQTSRLSRDFQVRTVKYCTSWGSEFFTSSVARRYISELLRMGDFLA